jgi:uncharacterized protein (TIGR03083 family)
MDEQYWSGVKWLRLEVADLLATLPETDWDTASLCQGWRVRDVAGHLSIITTVTTWDMIAAVPHAGLDANRINTHLAVRQGSRHPDEIVAAIRAHADDRCTARVLDARNSLFDIIVHSQDIAIPLGKDLAVPSEHTRRGVQRVWEMGWPFHARRRFSGLTLRATDTDWTVGAGPEVTGTALSLLLLLTGRTTAALHRLEGPGMTALERSVTQ